MEKVTSEEAYLAYIKTLGIYDEWLLRSLNSFNWIYKNSIGTYTITWWAKREYARLTQGVYQVSEVLNRLNKQFPIFAHISLDNPKLVAFTPDAHCGENDKQIRITIGKLISKYLPIISQKCLQEMIIDHESEISPEILWASGQELTDIYKNMGSIGACMSKDNWQVHPTVAYHTDEIKLAYIKKGGNIVARSLVYEPKDKSKKVFIRMYPKGHSLEKHLNALGYVAGNFVGAKLNTVKIKRDQYALPYLDGNNTIASSDTSTTALIDGQITVLNSALKNAIQSIYPEIYNKIIGYTVNGYANFENINSSDFIQTCIISNKEYSLLDLGVKPIRVYVNGQFGNTIAKHVPDEWVPAREINTRNYVLTHKDNIIYIDTDAFVLTDPNVLTSKGYKQLDKELYPNSQNKWLSRFVLTHDNKVINPIDAVYINHYDGVTVTSKTLHNSEFKAKNYLKLYGGNYCTKDSKFVNTTSGKRVIPGVNHFYTLIDGTHVIRRPKAYETFYGKGYYAASYSELTEYLNKNKEEFYKEYLLDILAKRSLVKAARILLEDDYYASVQLSQAKDLSVIKVLEQVSKNLKVKTYQRKVAGYYLSELTAVEY